MNDGFLNALRQKPSSAFEERLRRRLRDNDGEAVVPTRSRRNVAIALSTVALAALLAVPAVRASASQFLSLFRATNFVAVHVDPSRLDRLASQDLEIGKLIGENVQVVVDPGPPIAAASLDQAARTAGMSIAVPQWLPDGTNILETTVTGERVVRITASATRLQQVMDALGISDLTAPPELEGQVVNVRVPPVVMVRYEHGNRRSRLLQAQTPQVTLPTTVDLATLGEIGLRILGLSPDEARGFAHAIDWPSTLLVPIPPVTSSFRQITVNGRPGMLLQHQPSGQALTTVVLWSDSDRVFGLLSIARMEDVLAMAESVR